MVGFDDSVNVYKDASNSSTQPSSPTNEKQSLHPRAWCGLHGTGGEQPQTKNVYNYSGEEEKEKTPMCRIAELARFHRLKHEYKLMDESGPAHKKLFTVQLVLCPTQVFEGSGASIKKAQQAAAAVAWNETTFTKPPEKNKKNRKDGNSPPVLLFHVCRRLDLPEPVYTASRNYGLPPFPLDSPYSPYPRPYGWGPPIPLGPGVVAPPELGVASRLSVAPAIVGGASTPPSLFDVTLSPPLGQSAHRPATPPYVCTLSIGQSRIVNGWGATKLEAQANAAKQALHLLAGPLAALDQKQKEAKAAQKKQKDEEEKEQGEEREQTQKQKSVISQVHECALHMKMTVEFEVLREEGRAHERRYVVRCRLTGGEHHLEADGEGKKKKEAKQAACAALINTLRTIESSPLCIASSLYKSQKKSNTIVRETKRKTIVKDKKSDPSYGHQINPVSRLIQVLQAKGEPEPKFHFVGENGQTKNKEFIVDVECMSLRAQGMGPNKRLAKRSAAEEMLGLLGCAKPLPEPGKSLLKRKEQQSPLVNIGVFDPNELMAAPPAPPPPPPVLAPVPDIPRTPSDTVKWGELSVETPPSSGSRAPSASPLDDRPSSPRRKVTFNNQVSACAPPDDSSYPSTEIAPLKSEVVGKVKRRGKDAKRMLTESQRASMSRMARSFLSGEPSEEDNVFRVETISLQEGIPDSAHHRLDKISTTFRFSVHYTNFPKGGDGGGGHMEHFALVSLGVEKPIVCHGCGPTAEAAMENAAYNALCLIGK